MKINVVFTLVVSLLLSSCAGVVMLGAAGSMVTYDRRSLTMIEQDAHIFYVINRAITNDRRFQSSHVIVTSYNRAVLLTGEVTSTAQKQEAERIAQNTPQVRRVYNELTIAAPLSFRTQSHDALVTGKVRSRLLLQKGLESGSIRIVTEGGVVYLLGVATHEQADLAVNAARQVDGVEKVVKVFQYIT